MVSPSGLFFFVPVSRLLFFESQQEAADVAWELTFGLSSGINKQAFAERLVAKARHHGCCYDQANNRHARVLPDVEALQNMADQFGCIVIDEFADGYATVVGRGAAVLSFLRGL